MSNLDKKITELNEISSLDGSEKGYAVHNEYDYWFSFATLKSWLAGFFAKKEDIYTKNESDEKYLTIDGGNSKLAKNGGLRTGMAVQSLAYFDASGAEKTITMEEGKILTLSEGDVQNVEQNIDYASLSDTETMSSTDEIPINHNGSKKITMENLKTEVFSCGDGPFSYSASCKRKDKVSSGDQYSNAIHITNPTVGFLSHSNYDTDRNTYTLQYSSDNSSWTSYKTNTNDIVLILKPGYWRVALLQESISSSSTERGLTLKVHG